MDDLCQVGGFVPNLGWSPEGYLADCTHRPVDAWYSGDVCVTLLTRVFSWRACMTQLTRGSAGSMLMYFILCVHLLWFLLPAGWSIRVLLRGPVAPDWTGVLLTVPRRGKPQVEEAVLVTCCNDPLCCWYGGWPVRPPRTGAVHVGLGTCEYSIVTKTIHCCIFDF